MAYVIPDDWFPGVVPENVRVGESSYIDSSQSFELYRGRRAEAVRIGKAVGIYLPTMFDVGPKGRVTIGDYAMLNGPRIICDELVEIGSHCLISWNVVLMDTYRVPVDVEGRRRELVRAAGLPRKERRLDAGGPGRPVRIGNNVWLGFDVIVLPGVMIGEGSVVGARSVVAEDVPPYTVVAGNPARAIKRIG